MALRATVPSKRIGVQVPIGQRALDGDLSFPPPPIGGLVLFAHGSGSSRHSPRNQAVAQFLQQHGFATLLIDLLTAEQEAVDRRTGEFRFDVEMLALRLAAIIDWLRGRSDTSSLALGLFGASTGAAAALMAAVERPDDVGAIVSRGGRPDLAGAAVVHVACPTLLIVGDADVSVLELNRQTLARMRGRARLHVVPGATHLFEEPGALDEVARLASEWFTQYLVDRRGDGGARAR